MVTNGVANVNSVKNGWVLCAVADKSNKFMQHITAEISIIP